MPFIEKVIMKILESYHILFSTRNKNQSSRWTYRDFASVRLPTQGVT
jgi:hypothetical protein